MRPRFTYANVVSSLALFLVLTGGAAYALEGSNTVFSDDIVDGDVKVADVGQGAVATDEIANGQVKAADIGAGEIRTGNVANDNLTGGDVFDNSLKGADIDESTLSSIGGGGPAGGDLTGTYPNPRLSEEAFYPFDIARVEADRIGIPDDAIQISEIQAGQVGVEEIRAGAVRSAELATPLLRPGEPVTIDGGESANGDWGSGQAGAECGPGEALLYGLGEWLENSSGEELAIVEVRVDYLRESVAAVGISDSGAEEFRAVAVCLPTS